MTAGWDVLRAELADTMRSTQYAKPLVPCFYCGVPTRALGGICTAHDDLPANDPLLNEPRGELEKKR